MLYTKSVLTEYMPIQVQPCLKKRQTGCLPPRHSAGQRMHHMQVPAKCCESTGQPSWTLVRGSGTLHMPCTARQAAYQQLHYPVGKQALTQRKGIVYSRNLHTVRTVSRLHTCLTRCTTQPGAHTAATNSTILRTCQAGYSGVTR